MSSKSKKGSGGHKSKSAEEEIEEPLQAVVFADSFETRFAPFTLERPRCLLPLANTPLIEYTCEFLANAGVEEVILYCGNHTDQVEEYLNNSKWTAPTAPFTLEIIRSDARSVGDAMRDLDHKQLITGDFLCVYGDVVSNLSLESALTAHRTRRETNKKAIMTMVLREAGENHRTQSQYVRPAFVIDPSDQRCVHYEQIRPWETTRLDLAEEVFREHVEVEVREDLIDCGIDICTPEVLAQYTDNFDWQAPRRGFLYGLLKDFETNQLMVHAHVVAEGYAARVKNLQAFDAITRDVVARWTYPLCPDANLSEGQSFQMQKGGVYKEDGVVLARSCVIGRNTVLGKSTSIGDGSVISNSVIGRRCVIGKRVRISGAHIWDDARIGDDSTIEKTVIANGASVGKECHLQAGAMLSYGVSITDGTTVKADARISRLKRKRGYEKDELVEGASDPKVVGSGGQGFHVEAEEDEDEFVESLISREIYMSQRRGSAASISTFNSEDEDSDLGDHAPRGAMRSESFASMGSEEDADLRRKAADFHHDATTSIVDALQKNEDADTIQLELQALRLSSNAEDSQVRRAVAVSLMKRIAGLVESGESPKDAVNMVLPAKKLLIQRCVATDRDEYAEQVEFLLFMQTDLTHREQGDKILLFASNVLAHGDLVEAEGFEQWWEDARSSATEELERVRAETKQLVDVLVGDDESSEEEDGSDSDSD